MNLMPRKITHECKCVEYLRTQPPFVPRSCDSRRGRARSANICVWSVPAVRACEVRGPPRALNSILYSNTLSGKMRRVVINIFVLVKCTQYLHATILTLVLLKECNHIQVVRTPFEPCATGSTFSRGKSHTALAGICERFTAIRSS